MPFLFTGSQGATGQPGPQGFRGGPGPSGPIGPRGSTGGTGLPGIKPFTVNQHYAWTFKFSIICLHYEGANYIY